MAAALWGAACTTDPSERPRDSGPPDDSNGDDDLETDSGTAVSCNPTVTHLADWNELDPAASSGRGYGEAFAWAGARIAVVSRLTSGGYRIMTFDPLGESPAVARTLWPDTADTGGGMRLAVSNDVVAVVDQGSEPYDAESQRSFCRLALVRLTDFESIQSPTRFSDPAEQSSLRNEPSSCDVASLGDGFVLVWQQASTRVADSTVLLAQRIGPNGSPRGERLTLADGVVNPADARRVASVGGRVVVAISVPAGETTSSLALIDEDDSRMVPLVLNGNDGGAGHVQLQAAHGGFIFRSGDSFWLLDRDGRSNAGATPLSSSALIGPLGSGYVTVQSDGYLTATSLNERLGSRSKALGLSDDRGASASALVGDLDGKTVAVAYLERERSDDQSRFTIATLACGDEQPGPLGPTRCPNQAPLQPLDDGCTDAVCHVALRFDYLTLGLRGWSVTGGGRRETSADEAHEVAQATFTTNHKEPFTLAPVHVGGPQAGMYHAFAAPGEVGAFALIGAQSGVVAAAGSIEWAGRGRYWLPATWSDASVVACGDTAAQPAETFSDPATCSSQFGTKAPAAIADAIDTALRTNLAASMAERGPFSAYAYLYTPSVGTCSPQLTEYVVVLTRLR